MKRIVCLILLASAALAQSVDYAARSKVYLARRDYVRAEQDARLAVQKAPSSGDAHRLLGTVYTLRGNYAGAVTEFQTAVRLNPRDANAYYNLGIVYFKQNKLADSVRALSEAVRLNPKDAAAFEYRATVYQKQGNAKAAEADRLTAASLKKKTEVLR